MQNVKWQRLLFIPNNKDGEPLPMIKCYGYGALCVHRKRKHFVISHIPTGHAVAHHIARWSNEESAREAVEIITHLADWYANDETWNKQLIVDILRQLVDAKVK